MFLVLHDFNSQSASEDSLRPFMKVYSALSNYKSHETVLNSNLALSQIMLFVNVDIKKAC